MHGQQCRGNQVCKRQTQKCSAKESKTNQMKRKEDNKLIIEVSSVHETHKHASLNDFCVSFLIQKGRVNVAFVHTEISRIS